MKSIKIAGVPEHFNAPWKYAIANNLFAMAGINVEFIEYNTGTGAMCRDLSANMIDMAVLLTEGILQHQKIDPSIKIISQFVDTPLNWGIYVYETSSFESLVDLQNACFGISRRGSGSHLMVQVLAKQQNWHFDKINFLELGAIHSLAAAIRDKTADVFLWETFTTQPFVKDFQLRPLDILTSPWPCFQIATTKIFSEQTEIIQKILAIIFSISQKFNCEPDVATAVINQFYHLSHKDSLAWLKTTRWTEKIHLNKEMIKTFNDFF